MSKVKFPLPDPSDREPSGGGGPGQVDENAYLVAEILGQYFTADEIRDGFADGDIQVSGETPDDCDHLHNAFGPGCPHCTPRPRTDGAR